MTDLVPSNPPTITMTDWRQEAVTALLRLPVVALFACFLYVIWQVSILAIERDATHTQELTAIVSTCVDDGQ